MCLERWQIFKETSAFLALSLLEGNIQQKFFFEFFPPKWGKFATMETCGSRTWYT
jgi:hypothetical protein